MFPDLIILFRGLKNFDKYPIFLGTNFLILSIPKPSLGSCEMPEKCWASGRLAVLTFIETDRQTDCSKVYIDYNIIIIVTQGYRNCIHTTLSIYIFISKLSLYLYFRRNSRKLLKNLKPEHFAQRNLTQRQIIASNNL